MFDRKCFLTYFTTKQLCFEFQCVFVNWRKLGKKYFNLEPPLENATICITIDGRDVDSAESGTNLLAFGHEHEVCNWGHNLN